MDEKTHTAPDATEETPFTPEYPKVLADIQTQQNGSETIYYVDLLPPPDQCA